MNGRIAKILRKRAEQENIGTAKEYQHHKKSIFEIEGTRYCSTFELKNCTRKAYKKLRQSIYYKAQSDFYTYRRLISPDNIIGQFYKDITQDLQEFYDDIKAGKSPELMINCPPQHEHGKSSAVVEFFEWAMGKDPDWANIYTSFSGRLGVRANMKIQRDLVKLNKKTKRPIYGSIFPETKISAKNVVTLSQNYKKNSELIEIIDKKGSFRNTTVGGAITGESITGFGVIDDLLKGREEA